MKHLLLTSALALGLAAGGAVAQTTTQTQTTTTVTPAPAAPMVDPPLLVAPPVGTLSTTTTQKIIGADGTQTDKTETTYRNTDGVADDTVTRTTTVAPPAVATTSSYSSSTVTKDSSAPIVCPPRTHWDMVFQACEK